MVLLAAALAALLRPAFAAEQNLPLTLGFALVQQLLQAHLQVTAGAPWTVEDQTGCQRLQISTIRLAQEASRLRFEGTLTAQGGASLAGSCFRLLAWQGRLRAGLQPQMAPDGRSVRFKVVDSELLADDGGPAAMVDWLWSQVRGVVEPRLAGFQVDLGPALDQLNALLPLFWPDGRSDGAPAVQLAHVSTQPEGLRIGLALQIPDAAAATADAAELPAQPPPAAALSAADWQTMLDQIDSFLSFVTKAVATLAPSGNIRTALLEILLDARHALIDAYERTPEQVAGDVRALFLSSWARLAPLLREIGPGLPAADGLRLLGFVAAGDALTTLDALAPATGLVLSADGLRRFALLLVPSSGTDPLRYSLEIDPELRALFGFGAPPADEPPDEPPADRPDASRTEIPTETPAGTPAEPFPSTSPAPATDRFHFWPQAHAAASPAVDSARLNRWLPKREELDAYLAEVAKLLHAVAAKTAAGDGLTAAARELFDALMLATAWKESCWRQYIAQGGKRVPLTSPVGSVGLMQINTRVWRGFYDVGKLKQDIAYNARAGAEILRKYLIEYALAKEEHKKPGGLDNLARATYAAYNGGPSALSRYRNPKAAKRAKRVDAAFYRYYQRIRAGEIDGVKDCYGA